MVIRAYHLDEKHEMWQLFHQTVHYLDTQHYSQKQLYAWSSSLFDKTLWSKKLAKLNYFSCINEKK